MRISEISQSSNSGPGIYELFVDDEQRTNTKQIFQSYEEAKKEYDSWIKLKDPDKQKLNWNIRKVAEVPQYFQHKTTSSNPQNIMSDQDYYTKTLHYWTDQVYGDEEKAKTELDDYIWAVDSLIEHGGTLYRVIFIDDLAEFNSTDLGAHWSVTSDIFKHYPDTAAGNYVGSYKKKLTVELVAEVPPNNVTNLDVDVRGNWDEFEVNIIDPRRAKYTASVDGKVFWQSHP